jgi:hypothetical protein
MNSERQAFQAFESSISSQDAELIWGSSQDNDRYRSAPLYEEPQESMELQKPLSQKIFERSEEHVLHPQLHEEDPMFLTRYVMFASQVALASIFQFVLDFTLANDVTSKNVQVDRTNSRIRGGLFDETRFVEYNMTMFTFGGRLGLKLDIQEGDRLAIQTFWNELNRALQQSGYTESQDDESEDESEYDFESDSEDGFGLDLLQESKFLKFGEEPELIDQMFEDLSNPNFMQQTLLLLAWNCQDAQNFQAVTGENQAQQLFDTIIACMISTAADFCLPIARCASLLVSQLVDTHDINVTKEQFDVLVQTLVQWSITNQDNEQKLTSSEEVASILSSQMSKMAPLAADWKDTLQQVYTQAPYDSVRANLHEVIRAY